MDAYNVYLNTFRYVMNADPCNKNSWWDIFKYLPCLRKVLSCCVCGGILKNPHGPSNGRCLHYVCYKCIGGKMNTRPSCSGCKNSEDFKEDKKFRVLILCFKRLCAYISNSRLGAVIQSSSLNGHACEVENTQKVLQDAEQFEDEYEFTPPPTEPLGIVKQKDTEHHYTFSEYKASTSGFHRKPEKSVVSPKAVTPICKQKRGRKKGISNISLKSPPKSNASIHVKRLKRKALTTSRQQTVKSQNRIQRSNATLMNQGLLVSQRPHRELSGKFSVGQLWRETFVEETLKAPEVEIYPDSGIEIGNLSDQDHCSLSPKTHEKAKDDKSKSTEDPSIEKVVFPLRDTRLHPMPLPEDKEVSATATDENCQKLKLPVKIPQMRFPKIPRKYNSRTPFFRKKDEEVVSSSSKLSAKLPAGKTAQIRSRGINAQIKSLTKQRGDICGCARFKRPNQLTCFGQKCPCYRDRKACVDCLCNGCKNPRPQSDSAPPLMHMSRAKENYQCLSPDVDMSMPRLSPIPRM